MLDSRAVPSVRSLETRIGGNDQAVGVSGHGRQRLAPEPTCRAEPGHVAREVTQRPLVDGMIRVGRPARRAPEQGDAHHPSVAGVVPDCMDPSVGRNRKGAEPVMVARAERMLFPGPSTLTWMLFQWPKTTWRPCERASRTDRNDGREDIITPPFMGRDHDITTGEALASRTVGCARHRG